MAENLIVSVDVQAARRALNNIEEDKARQLVGVVKRAYKPKPDKKDIQELQKWLEECPEIWRLVFDMAQVIEDNLIRRIVSDEAARLALEKNVQSMKHGLGYEKASALEMSLIDHIALCWLRCEWAEYQLVLLMRAGDIRMSVVEFWERRLSSAQVRYLRACGALTRIRRLVERNPTLQVNIASEGGQQVNIAGDIAK